MIFHISDTHFAHANIIQYSNRPFANVGEMDEAIISGINDKVGPNDLLIHHGDFCFGASRDDNFKYVATARKYLDKINCKNVTLVGGNHDRLYVKQKGDMAVNEEFWDLFNRIHPMGLELRLTAKLCSEHKIPNKFRDLLVVCTHYSLRVWNRSHHNGRLFSDHGMPSSINLYGHSHGGLPGLPFSMDCGWDVWHGPISTVEAFDHLCGTEQARRLEEKMK